MSGDPEEAYGGGSEEYYERFPPTEVQYDVINSSVGANLAFSADWRSCCLSFLEIHKILNRRDYPSERYNYRSQWKGLC